MLMLTHQRHHSCFIRKTVKLFCCYSSYRLVPMAEIESVNVALIPVSGKNYLVLDCISTTHCVNTLMT